MGIKYKVVLERFVRETRVEWINQDDDWDGRPVEDQWDAGDLAYDIAAVEDPDWQVDHVEVIDD